MNLKLETWNGHEIRFIEKEAGDWWAVLTDVCNPLDLQAAAIKRRLSDGVISSHTLNDVNGRSHEYLIVNEFGIYETVFESRKQEAKSFKKWVFEVIKALRQASGLEAFQIFCMLDKEHQKEAMKRLNEGLNKPARVDYIKANTIADKAVSTRHGQSKMLKKGDMPPEWLPERQPVLDDTVDLMAANERFGLGLSVSRVIYGKHCRAV